MSSASLLRSKVNVFSVFLFATSILRYRSEESGQRLKADRSCVGTRSRLRSEVFEEVEV